jgi:glyoxalase/bleomycin resistance protein/dioxygenase superfamily protein
MALHRLTSITIGVPNVTDTASYYSEWGLTPAGDGWFSTRDGGRQLRITHAPTRRLTEMSIATDDEDDLARAAARLQRLGVAPALHEGRLSATEPVTGVKVTVSVQPRFVQDEVPPAAVNGPGHTERHDQRATANLRTDRVRPRKLGHAVIGSTDHEATIRFFLDGFGFKLSDQVKGHAAFMRCSTDHHNLLVQDAPVTFLHHTSWQVDDVDEIGRGAMAMLEDHPDRHVWGLGRHYSGSNFFWYLKDPAGTFSEYYSDLDCIIDDQVWTPEDLEGARGLYTWGPPPPPSFLHPEDLAGMMTGAHSAR